MKQFIATISILLLAITIGLSACAPGARETVKDKKTTPDVVVDTGDTGDTGNGDDGQVTVPDGSSLKTGDIIFHKSQSKQSKAIKEASESEWTHVGILVAQEGEWYVAEAIGPVVLTKLQAFIDRGENKEYKIYRFKYFDADTMEEQLSAAIAKQNKAYDIYFEISDESTYCSELVYKAMLDVTGHELGHMQQFKDLKLDGPQVKALIKRRLTDKGRKLNVEEPIITPAAQMADANMTLIKSSSEPTELESK